MTINEVAEHLKISEKTAYRLTGERRILGFEVGTAWPFRLRGLAFRACRQQLKADFEARLDGFSPNVQEVLDKFKFRNQIRALAGADS